MTAETQTIWALEEFVLVSSGKVGILLDAPLAKLWSTGGHRALPFHERGLSIIIPIVSHLYEFHAVYAPTSTRMLDRFEFFDTLEEHFASRPTSHTHVFGGDWNSHIGNDHESTQIGKFTLRTPTSAHARQMLDFLAHHRLHHIDSYHSTRWRGTWLRPQNSQYYELDYFVSPENPTSRFGKLRTCCLPTGDHFVKVIDMFLLGARGQRQLPRREQTGDAHHRVSGFDRSLKPRAKLNVHLLRGGGLAAVACQTHLASRIAELLKGVPRTTSTSGAMSTTIPTSTITWDTLSTTLRTAAEEVMGRSRRRVEVPVLEHLRPAEKQRRQALQLSWQAVQHEEDQQHRHELRRTHQQLVRQARRERRQQRTAVILDTAAQMEHAMDEHDLGKFYRLMRQLGASLNDKDTREQQHYTPEEARTPFLKLAGSANEVDLQVNASVEQKEPAKCLDKPLWQVEFEKALKEMKDSAPGDDEITIGMIRSAGQEFQTELWLLVSRLWTTSPGDWEDSIHRSAIILLWKHKGSRSDLNTYRGISLLSICSRIVARICSKRLMTWSESANLLSNEQWAFRPYRRTIDAAVLVKMLVEEYTKAGQRLDDSSLALVLFDIEKAYPSVSHNLCWSYLERLGVPPLMLERLRGLHSLTTYVIRTPLGDSDPYQLLRGLREGCPSSCAVFNLLQDHVLQEIKQRLADKGIAVKSSEDRPLPRGSPDAEGAIIEHLLCVLGFADDTTGITTRENQPEVEATIIEIMEAHGAKVNRGKLERLATGHKQDIEKDWVQKLRYLGVYIDMDGSNDTDTFERIQGARRVWRALWRQLPRLKVPPEVKGRIIEATVCASLLYGCEIRSFTEADIEKYRRFLGRCYRGTIFGGPSDTLTGMQGNANMTDVRLRLGVDDVAVMIRKKQLAYLGHLARLPRDRIEKCALGMWIRDVSSQKWVFGTGKGKRGLKDTWWRLLQELAPYTGMNTDEWPLRWMEFAGSGDHSPEHGVRWRKACAKAVAHHRQEMDQRVWTWRAERRRERNDELARAESTRALDGLVECPRCLFRCRQLASHLASCTGTQAVKPGTSKPLKQCERCGQHRVDINSHMKFCKGIQITAPQTEKRTHRGSRHASWWASDQQPPHKPVASSASLFRPTR